MSETVENINQEITAEENPAVAHMTAVYLETRLNGSAIKWRYWVGQMATLSAAEAACLMSALEPDKFATLSERPGKDDPSQNIEKTRKIQRLAESQGKLSASPMEWTEWAHAHNISVHANFLLELRNLKKAPATSGKVGAGAAAPEDAEAEHADRAPATKGVEPEQTTSSDVEPEKTKKPKRINENRAFLMTYIKEGVDPNIESIWLHIRNNAGKENFLFVSSSEHTATTIDGKKVQKMNLARVLRDLLKMLKIKQ